MAKTRVGSSQAVSTTLQWKIQNYTSYGSFPSGPGMYIESHPCIILNKSWHMRLYPNGTNKSHALENYVTIFLYVNCKNNEQIKVKYSFTVLNSENKIIASHRRLENIFKNQAGYGKLNLLKSCLVKNMDNITILCEISTEDAIIIEAIPVTIPDKVQISQTFKNYLDNAQLSDIKFFVENKTIFAHKLVLAANSPVFAAMFNHEMRENRDKTVTVKDISYNVFHQLLRFIYAGETDLSGDMASELLKASDKYEILNLKQICETEISKNFSTSNVIQCLNLADMYKAIDLKKNAIDFIVSHGQEMIDQPEFDSLRSLHADLFKDVFRSVFTNPEKKRKTH